jgi:O-antigen ligase
VMLLSLGKTAIVAGVFSVMLFLLLQKQVARSAAVFLGITAVAFVILSVTPLASHLESYQGASTLTGRTFIWTTALSAIRQKWLFGHGYLSTYFSWGRNSGLVAGFVNLHNGFLEVAYNSGIFGLLVLLMIHFAILRNVWRSIRGASVLRARAPRDPRSAQAYLLSVGALALYANLSINGLFNTTFGGRPTSPFMLFLAVFVMVDVLRRQIAERLRATAANVKRPRADWFPVEVPVRS